MRYRGVGKDFRVRKHPFWERVEAGVWESAVYERLLATVRPTDTIFDVGAWIGVYTLLLSHLAERVIAFEPCPFSRNILIDNLRLNGITNVTVESYALSDSESMEKIYYYNPSGLDDVLASSMLNMVHRGEYGDGLPIPTTTIDAYCGRKDITPNGMKIDVEGYEDKVLKGCHIDCWKIVELHGFAGSKLEGEFIDDRHIFVEAA